MVGGALGLQGYDVRMKARVGRCASRLRAASSSRHLNHIISSLKVISEQPREQSVSVAPAHVKTPAPMRSEPSTVSLGPLAYVSLSAFVFWI